MNTSSRRRIARLAFHVTAIGTACLSAQVQAWQFTKLDVPGARCTMPARINDAGQIAGMYQDGVGTYPFVYQNGTYQKFPQLGPSRVGGLNNLGQVIGGGGPSGRFMFSGGVITQITDVPYRAWQGGINSAGHNVGAIVSPGQTEEGFVERGIGGQRSYFSAGGTTVAEDINDSGLIVGLGSWRTAFTYDGTSFTYLDIGFSRTASGVGNQGAVAGTYVRAENGPSHGYIYLPGGKYQTIDFPASLATSPITAQGASDINSAGWVVGHYEQPGPSGTTCAHGYLAKPTDIRAAYRGCYADTDMRALPVQLMSAGATPENCTAAALAKGYAFAGVQDGGACFAGNTLGFAKKSETECRKPCAADPSQTCGGPWLNGIYATGLPVPVQPAPVPQGCYVDQSDRALPVTLSSSATVSIADCVAGARARNLVYAGLQFGGQCYAGNALRYARLPDDSQCRTPCAADAGKSCGGVWRNSIYATGVALPPKPAGNAHLGCYVDDETRTLPVMLMSSGATPATCVALAKAKGYPYAGLQYHGQCYAGEALPPRPAPAGECNTACTASPLETCGGGWRNSVYRTQ